MNMHIAPSAFADPRALTEAVFTAASERTATIERNPMFPQMPWQIRCYGQGLCTYGDGALKRFNNRDRAAQVAETWIETGVSPADQRVPS